MIQLIEELSMNAWPSLQTCFYDGWVLRFARGYTKRANSIVPVYTSCVEPGLKIDFCERIYAQWGLPAIFKLTAESKPQGLDELLAQKGYQRLDETAVRLLDLSRFTPCMPGEVTIEEKITEAWTDGFFRCSSITDANTQAAARQVLANIRATVVCAAKKVGDQIAGCGFGVVERGYVGIFDIIVAPNFRRNGFGFDIMNGILMQAKGLGAHTSYLQVVSGNTAAENLYTRLGYREAYRYWYRKGCGTSIPNPQR